ncbi:hypothetical protein [Sphingomonas rubra]|uniref:Uncharacterized protein n=1 Tax=Sphingomonas rubra TaxID=634430 RepID=A0A1I5R726_9SPHN|nr:hypothetical protein [Sphingomonas rubra]SFP54329.1 hypothetical protein SAMN04488241_10345 [Sphingomonas rubra]
MRPLMPISVYQRSSPLSYKRSFWYKVATRSPALFLIAAQSETIDALRFVPGVNESSNRELSRGSRNFLTEVSLNLRRRTIS